MLYEKFGKVGITERFLEALQREALRHRPERPSIATRWGASSPTRTWTTIVRATCGAATADNASYNATFTYPEGGRDPVRARPNAIAGVRDSALLSLGERVESDRPRVNKVKRTPTKREEIRLRVRDQFRCPSTIALLKDDRRLTTTPAVFTWNKVLVFNLGFDRKGLPEVHPLDLLPIEYGTWCPSTGSASTTTSSAPTA